MDSQRPRFLVESLILPRVQTGLKVQPPMVGSNCTASHSARGATYSECSGRFVEGGLQGLLVRHQLDLLPGLCHQQCTFLRDLSSFIGAVPTCPIHNGSELRKKFRRAGSWPIHVYLSPTPYSEHPTRRLFEDQTAARHYFRDRR